MRTQSGDLVPQRYRANDTRKIPKGYPAPPVAGAPMAAHGLPLPSASAGGRASSARCPQALLLVLLVLSLVHHRPGAGLSLVCHHREP